MQALQDTGSNDDYVQFEENSITELPIFLASVIVLSPYDIILVLNSEDITNISNIILAGTEPNLEITSAK